MRVAHSFSVIPSSTALKVSVSQGDPMITPLPSSHCGPRSQVESPSSCFKLGVESGNGRVAWLAWKTRLRCKTIGCRTGPRSASPAHFGAKLFELAWPQRFASLLSSMWWKTVWWSQALQNLNTRLSWNVWGRLGKDLHHANGHSTMSAAWQSLRLKGKQSCLLGRREAMTRGRCPMSLCLANFGWALTRWRSQDTMASVLLLAKDPMEKYSLPVVSVDACMLWKSCVAEMPLQRLSMKSCYTNPCRSWKIAIGNGSRNCWLRIARGGHFHGCRCLLVAWPWHGACCPVSGLRGTLCLQSFGGLSLHWWSCTSMQGSCTVPRASAVAADWHGHGCGNQGRLCAAFSNLCNPALSPTRALELQWPNCKVSCCWCWSLEFWVCCFWSGHWLFFDGRSNMKKLGKQQRFENNNWRMVCGFSRFQATDTTSAPV